MAGGIVISQSPQLLESFGVLPIPFLSNEEDDTVAVNAPSAVDSDQTADAPTESDRAIADSTNGLDDLTDGETDASDLETNELQLLRGNDNNTVEPDDNNHNGNNNGNAELPESWNSSTPVTKPDRLSADAQPEGEIIPDPVLAFSETAALQLIQTWSRAKALAYAPPYDTSLMREVLAGFILQGRDGTGGRLGSVRWLRDNNSSYRYNTRNITLVPGSFNREGDRAEVTANVDERGDFYNSQGNWVAQPSFDKTMQITYYFEVRMDSTLEQRRWFIVQCAGVSSCEADLR